VLFPARQAKITEDEREHAEVIILFLHYRFDEIH
jgi:hypothetical protein